jgi:uncharacterized spore protein YtfJ
MSLNRLFDSIEAARETGTWQAAFGEPQTIGDRTLIPVARVGYAFGMGFGSGQTPPEEEGEPVSTGEGGGGGVGSTAKSLGTIVVTPDEVYFESTAEEGKIAIVGTLVGALFIWQLFKTLRQILGR